jgi:hypothetical protein
MIDTNNLIQNPNNLTTTFLNRDLRKLTRKSLTYILTSFGVSAAECSKLSRWDMVQMVREHSTKAERMGISSSLHKLVINSTFIETEIQI